MGRSRDRQVDCNYKITFTNNNLISAVYNRACALDFRCAVHPRGVMTTTTD